MLIGQAVRIPGNLLLGMLFFLEIILCLGLPKDRTLAPALVLKLNIAPLLMLWQRFLGCVSFLVNFRLHFAIPLWSIVTISVPSTSSNLLQHQRTKHIEIDLHFVRDKVAIGDVKVQHVPTSSQYADIFTKGLPSSIFTEFRSSLNVCGAADQTAGGC